VETPDLTRSIQRGVSTFGSGEDASPTPNGTAAVNALLPADR
jgi:hypothetical protein